MKFELDEGFPLYRPPFRKTGVPCLQKRQIPRRGLPLAPPIRHRILAVVIVRHVYEVLAEVGFTSLLTSCCCSMFAMVLRFRALTTGDN